MKILTQEKLLSRAKQRLIKQIKNALRIENSNEKKIFCSSYPNTSSSIDKFLEKTTKELN